MLEVQDIEKAFKKKVAVDGVNFYLEKGESVGLLGPNGAGKSTTISMISTLLPPDKGNVIYNGKDAIKNPTELRKELGVVPQEIALYEELSAYENMKFFGKVYGLKGKQLKDKIQEVLELVGLEDRQKDAVKDYSGGMKRRINIAVALMHDPEILIMDEPTVGIDPQSRNYILEMVRHFNEERGMTVLYTSHYMEEVEKLCDRIYIMDHGKVIASGTKEELKSLLSNEEKVLVTVETTKESFITQLETHPSIHQVNADQNQIDLIVSKGDHLLSSIFDFAKETQVNITGIQIVTPTLEDVFLHLTGRKLRD
jgi:ABC-2 type transport system ATP-binding protein